MAKTFRYKSCSRYLYLDILLLLCDDDEQCPGHVEVGTNAELDRITSLKGLNLFYHNVRGLLKNINNITKLSSSFRNIDILSLSRAHISNREPEKIFSINNYSLIRTD